LFKNLKKKFKNLFKFFQNDPSSMNAQINHQAVTSYGATEHVVGNPFAAPPASAYPRPVAYPPPQQVSQSNPFANPSMLAEQVQPYPTDPYLHGTANQRDFNNQY
jgi:hypothetical protein